jgi:hypothetical protein
LPPFDPLVEWLWLESEHSCCCCCWSVKLTWCNIHCRGDMYLYACQWVFSIAFCFFWLLTSGCWYFLPVARRQLLSPGKGPALAVWAAIFHFHMLDCFCAVCYTSTQSLTTHHHVALMACCALQCALSSLLVIYTYFSYQLGFCFCIKSQVAK